MTVRLHHKEMRDLADYVSRHGWRVERTGSGHVLFLGPQGQRVTAPSTPSDRRSIGNVQAKLYRNGLPRPRPGGGRRPQRKRKVEQ